MPRNSRVSRWVGGLLRFARNDAGRARNDAGRARSGAGRVRNGGARCDDRAWRGDGVGLLIGASLVLVLGLAPGWAASPTSNRASNINSGDAASSIAPQLPTPVAGEDNTPRQFLIAARQAIAAGRTGEAQEALERAETRLLDRSTPLFRTDEAARGPLIQTISQARQALGAGDRMQAEQLTGQALATLGSPR